MRLIKRREPPFKTVDEAFDFFQKHGSDEFRKKIGQYFQSIGNLHFKVALMFFPVYLALASIVFLFDYKEINYQTYLLLKFLHIPARNPYGWNVSFILSFVFNLMISIFVIRAYDFSLLRKITKIRRKVKFFFACMGLFFMLLVPVFVVPIATLPVKSSACTLYSSPCWLQSDSMFFYANILLYMEFWCIFLILITFFYSKFSPNFTQENFHIKDKL